MKIRKELLVMALIVVAIVGLGYLLARGQQTPVQPGKSVGNITREDSHMTGKQGAKVTVVEFGDYQCPACGAAHPLLKQILAAYKDNPDFNFVFMNFPLPMHPNAQVSAEAAEAAGEQGKFWQMHDKIYENQKQWSESPNALDIFVGYAGELSLDTAKFKAAVEQRKFQSIIDADQSKGDELGVNATPTFYINGDKQAGIASFDSFKTIIDGYLAK